MKEKVMEKIKGIKTLWEKLARKTKMIFLGAVGVLLIMLLILVLILNRKNYVLLYDNLSGQESAGVLSVLSEAGITPSVRSRGEIYVLDKDENHARMQLATAGIATPSLGYDIYEKAGLTSTQSEKNQWYINGLQNRLQETIETFEEVSFAVVTLSVPQPSIYAVQNNTAAPTASIKIQKKPGRAISPEQVQGIINIVKNSVAGLTEDNISIADENGDMKFLAEQSQKSGTSKLELTEAVNRSVKDRIMTMLKPIYGEKNVEVAINSVLDTDARVTEQVEYVPHDKENPANNPINYHESESEMLRGEDGPAQGVVGANDNVDVPQYTTRENEDPDARAYANRDVYDYLVSSVKNQIVKEGLEIKDLTVAVVVNRQSMPDGERDQLIDLIARASGVSSDKISVQNFQFAGIDAVMEQPAPVITTLQALLISVAVAAFAGLVILLIIMGMRRKKRAMEERLVPEGSIPDQFGTPLVDLVNAESEDFEPISIPESLEQKLKLQIKDLAQSDPEIVAQLIKTWLVK